jgi:MFS family permease
MASTIIGDIKLGGHDATTHIESSLPECQFDPAHREYLLSRHGTVDLIPVPSSSPEDPLNWPIWKKNTHILLVAFHAMTTTFMAAGIIPGFVDFAKAYGTSIPKASYLTSVQILFLGVSPFLWCPLSSRFGRRPVFLFSTFGSMICNIAGARCTTFASQITTRIFTSICISPALGIGSAVVTELFFAHERAQKMGWWTLLTTIGTPTGPFVMGFVVQHLGLDWIFWIFAIINLVQFLAYLSLDTETLYPRPKPNLNPSQQPKPSYLTFPRINTRTLTLASFISPLFISTNIRILIPITSYAIVFCYANIALIVEMPIAIGEAFALTPQQTGLQFIALIIGSVLGEQLSSPLSDAFIRRRSKTRGVRPEMRLWISYSGFLTVIVGLLVWGFQIQNAEKGRWNVTPLIGAGIASFGNQVITTTLITYAVDSEKERSAEIGVMVNFGRQVWGFVSYHRIRLDLGWDYFLLTFGLIDRTLLFPLHVRNARVRGFGGIDGGDCVFVCGGTYRGFTVLGQ